MKILFILFAVVLLASCTTQRKAEGYFNKNLGQLAALCSLRFPNVDSAGTPYIADHVPANNIDYTKQIDSLEQEAQNAKLLADQLLNALNSTQPTTDTEKAKLKKQIGELLNQVQNLKAKYKPCIPDTAKIVQPIYRELGYKLADLRFQVGEQGRRADNLQHELQQAKTDGAKWKAQRNKLLWILFVIAGATATWVFIKLRSQIPIVGRP